jgi:hypothetical protein
MRAERDHSPGESVVAGVAATAGRSPDGGPTGIGPSIDGDLNDAQQTNNRRRSFNRPIRQATAWAAALAAGLGSQEKLFHRRPRRPAIRLPRRLLACDGISAQTHLFRVCQPRSSAA